MAAAISLLLALAVIILLLLHLYRTAFARPPNFPPGPPSLPIWGSYWLVLLKNYTFTHLGLQKLAHLYNTKVLGFFLGPFPSIVAADYESVREILTRPEFLGRPDTIVTQTRALGKRFGIFFNDGDKWKEQRRFMLKNMRDFGFGRRFTATEQNLQEEVQEMISLLNGEWSDKEVCRDGSILMPAVFYVPFFNLLWCMLGGHRYSRSDYTHVQELCRAALLFIRNVEPLGGAISLTPWLHHIIPHATGLEEQKAGNQPLLDQMKRAIDEHQSTFSSDHLRDFIDIYLQELKEKETSDQSVSFSVEQLMLTGVDMMLATATTIPGTISLAFQNLFRNPGVQSKVQEELDKVVGRNRLPTLDDRVSLPYTEATLREVMRRQTMLPLALPHLCMEDTELQGYSIPKSTLVFANLNSGHMDPKLWGDPEVFRPERFLDDNGSLKKKDFSFPFGAGKRLCPAETFSRQSLFVMFAALLQNFNFAPADPKKVLGVDDVYPGLAISPEDMWVKVTPRD